jgi:hypothetical protein
MRSRRSRPNQGTGIAETGEIPRLSKVYAALRNESSLLRPSHGCRLIHGSRSQGVDRRLARQSRDFGGARGGVEGAVALLD